MQTRLFALLLAFGVALAAPVRADSAGVFDYYVLALSWSPGWCDRTGAARGSEQCAPGRALGWTLHGLWPQHEEGWPEYCTTPHAPPSRAQTGAMADIMGTSGLAWHQWRKHGTCSGLSAADYFAQSRRAYDSVTRPEALRSLDRPVTLPATLIEEAFLNDNPGLSPDMLTVTCRDGQIQEVRICLTRALEPRLCAADTRRDCAARDALFLPIDR